MTRHNDIQNSRSRHGITASREGFLYLHVSFAFSLLFHAALGEKGTSGGEDVSGVLNAAYVLLNSGCLIVGVDGEGLLLLAFSRS
jgi:hypothetical protein